MLLALLTKHAKASLIKFANLTSGAFHCGSKCGSCFVSTHSCEPYFECHPCRSRFHPSAAFSCLVLTHPLNIVLNLVIALLGTLGHSNCYRLLLSRKRNCYIIHLKGGENCSLVKFSVSPSTSMQFFSILNNSASQCG